MAKSFLGIDIGNKYLKLASVSGGKVKKTAMAELPDSLVKAGQVVSYAAMADFIRSTMKENSLSSAPAAFVLNSSDTYVKNISVPAMTDAQLLLNIPYEFKDYIPDELHSYAYDYAVTGVSEDEENGKTLELLASASPESYLNELRNMLKKAGLKFAIAAPAECAYIGFLRQTGVAKEDKEYCFLDIGHEAIRMHVFKGEQFIVTRVLELGLGLVEQRIADSMHVDIHLAHTYFTTNYNNCQNSDTCLDAYSGISTELERAIHFYQFSNPDSNLEHVWLCGGGASVENLVKEIRQTLNVEVGLASELINKLDNENGFMFIPAIGITHQE